MQASATPITEMGRKLKARGASADDHHRWLAWSVGLADPDSEIQSDSASNDGLIALDLRSLTSALPVRRRPRRP
jgi:hypothetical protein